MSPRIVVVGGGPGGLFLAAQARKVLPQAQVVVFERNRREDSFGFGVVFSDATIRNVDTADPVLRDILRTNGRHWDRIEVWSKQQRFGFSGNGMSAVNRRVLLSRLQEHALHAGVDLRFATEAPPLADLKRDFDLVVGADGANSTVCRELERDRVDLGLSVETASAKFIWFGSTHEFGGLRFIHKASEHGNFAAHAYPIGPSLSTFIVETDEETWRRAGLDEFDVRQPPGPSDETSRLYLEALFSDDIEGAKLVANNSRWANFRTRRSQRWHDENVVLLGDAIHTAHFSVGSGTKMALEDAAVLARVLVDAFDGDLAAALNGYQLERAPLVGRIQHAARPSLSWWENFGFYQRAFDPLTFAFHFFSRSIDINQVAERDPELASLVRESWRNLHGSPPLESVLALPSGERLPRVFELESAEPGVVVGGTTTLQFPDEGSRTVVLVEAKPCSTDELRRSICDIPGGSLVLVQGDDTLLQLRYCEEIRLRGRGVAVLAADVGEAEAETILLSGRADAIARVPERSRATL
jgi:salicyloyl-CoA 5-hydroxylase